MKPKDFTYDFRNFRFIVNLAIILFFMQKSFSTDDTGLPSELDGWKRSGEIQIYSPDNLYEYINGAAELYLSYDFEALKVGEYIDTNKSLVVVDIYRHRTPLHAFGIYSQEKPLQGNFMEIGAQGYWQELMLNFVSGVYYVKISGSDISENSEQIIQNFACKIAQDLGGDNLLPQALLFFPDKDKIKNSEKFVAKNFLGYAFLHNVFTADYHNKDNQFSMFIFVGNTSEECRDMLMEYFKRTNTAIKDLTEGTYAIEDPYYGIVSIFWKSKFIGGVLDLSDDDLRQEYLQLLEKRINTLKETNSH